MGKSAVSMASNGKVIIVGDGAIGKTFLLTSLLADPNTAPIDWENPAYVPTAAKNNSVEWEYQDPEGSTEDFLLEVWDTAGQEALKSLRLMAYPDTDIFMIGYDMTREVTLENIVGCELTKLNDFSIEDEDSDDDEKANAVSSWIKEISHGSKATTWPEQSVLLHTSKLLPRQCRVSVRGRMKVLEAPQISKWIQKGYGSRTRSSTSVTNRLITKNCQLLQRLRLQHQSKKLLLLLPSKKLLLLLPTTRLPLPKKLLRQNQKLLVPPKKLLLPTTKLLRQNQKLLVAAML